MSVSTSVFRDAQSWRPEAEPERERHTLPAVDLAVRLLRAIAEDPLMRGSYRTAARGYLADLEPHVPRR